MQRDARGLALSTDSAEAARLFDRAIGEYLEYRKPTLATAMEALDADPEFCLAHCFIGYLFMLFGSHAVDGKVDAALAKAEAAQPARERARAEARGGARRLAQGRHRARQPHLGRHPGRASARHPGDAAAAFQPVLGGRSPISCATPPRARSAPGTKACRATAICSACMRSRWRNAATMPPPSPRAGARWNYAATTCGRSTRSRTCWKCRGGCRKASTG